MVDCVIHVAGPVKDGLQRCSRCGFILEDYREPKHVMVVAGQDPRLPTWPVGEGVLVMQGFKALVRGLRPDRDRSDEMQCYEALPEEQT